MKSALIQSEMSFFGYILNDGEKILAERIDGTMVRTKAAGISEGGICTGYSVLDNIAFPKA